MKACWVWVCLFLMCLMLAACSAEKPEMEQTQPVQSTDPSVPSVSWMPGTPENVVEFELAGRCKVPYTVNMSAARYISDPEKLPDVEGLENYDAAWFADHALLLIYETVQSGAMEVGIESILIENGCGNITLSHGPGEHPGTTAMTTWLIWAEVDAGLLLDWSVTNPLLENETTDR